MLYIFFFFSSRRRHTRCSRDWSSDVCSSDLVRAPEAGGREFSRDSPGGVASLRLGLSRQVRAIECVRSNLPKRQPLADVLKAYCLKSRSSPIGADGGNMLSY